MSNDLKKYLNLHDLAMDAAVKAVGTPKPVNKEYEALHELFDLAQTSLARAEVAEFEANRAKRAALALSTKLGVELELLAEKLGVEKRPFGYSLKNGLYTTPPLEIDEHEGGIPA